MDKLLNMVANGQMGDFKDRLKTALDTKLEMSREELRKEVGKGCSGGSGA